jgi:hypothetical protein
MPRNCHRNLNICLDQEMTLALDRLCKITNLAPREMMEHLIKEELKARGMK